MTNNDHLPVSVCQELRIGLVGQLKVLQKAAVKLLAGLQFYLKAQQSFDLLLRSLIWLVAGGLDSTLRISQKLQFLSGWASP